MVHSRQRVDNAHVEFLTGACIQEEIRRLVGRGADLSVAVAYWGAGGACHTGIATRDQSARGNVRILCDLHSGACNPCEIAKLQQCDRVEVRTLNDLHAKVWIGEGTVIVGSANASTSGLADESQFGSKVEAALVVDNPDLADKLRHWFDTKWHSPSARDIDEASLCSAKKIWKKRRKLAGEAAGGSSTEKTTRDASALKRRLLDEIAAVGLRLWSVDQRPDVTLRSVRTCQDDRAWKSDYDTYLRTEPRDSQRRRQLHREFGKNVKRRIRARSGRSGVKPRQPREDDLIGTYTELHADI